MKKCVVLLLVTALCAAGALMANEKSRSVHEGAASVRGNHNNFIPAQEKPLPRIAIAGIAIESSTFSPALTDEAAFRKRIGAEMFDYYPELREDGALRERAVWVPAMIAGATPGGAVTREAYESLVEQILGMLREGMPYDGLFLDIHGAMSVVGLDDPEGDFIVRVREVVGNETIISTCMDLHGNVSWRLAENTDLMTTYRMAPHEDSMESKQRAMFNLVERLESGKGKPRYKAWIPVPILLPGEQTSTRVEPAKSLYAAVAPAAAQEGIIDAGVWIGYAWADEPRNHGVVMVTGDDKEYVASFRLGVETDTYDVTGTVLSRREVTAAYKEVEEALLSFRGESAQMPPMYSAIKVNLRACAAGRADRAKGAKGRYSGDRDFVV